ncbi:phage head morphogenesis protein [Yersinia frederiksenii]|uniref:phage head morphogenesis protein n=1 Tax=Yersinia frederiksenii TaxID=29484 RepID=UPI00092CEAE4|nr:phage minor head protein [Yersinia frederiksenii]
MARAVGDIVNGTYDGSNDSVALIQRHLSSYAEIITPWAEGVASSMFDAVNRKESEMWRQASRDISLELRDIMANSAVGQVARSIVEENIKLMKSLPLEAADRVSGIHDRAIEAMINGERSKDFAAEIFKSGDVAESRAKLIARTEIGRASTALTQARSLSVGSEGYIWRTAEDGDVRHSHAKMEGKFVAWTNPPTLDGMTGHAGALPNCRCYCEVVIPEG